MKLFEIIEVMNSCGDREVKSAILNDIPLDILANLKKLLIRVCCKDQEMIFPMIKRV